MTEGPINEDKAAKMKRVVRRADPTLIVIGMKEFSVGRFQTDTLLCNAKNGRKVDVTRMWLIQNMIKFLTMSLGEKVGPFLVPVFLTTAMRRRTEVAPIELLIESLLRMLWVRFLVDRLETGE